MDTIKFDKKNTLVIAHRGLSGLEKENTNSAFVAAGNRSYYGIETDIHRTADGHFVVMHDDNLKRVAGEGISVNDVSLKTLQSVVFLDVDNTKDRIDLRPATLENYISICKKYEKHSVLELKDDFTDEEIAKILDIIKGYDYLDNVTFISFIYENLTKIRKIIPTQSAQFLFVEMKEEIINEIIADRLDADVYFKNLTEDVVKKLHAAGLKVNCWTVNEKEDAERLVKMGVDYITTNILE